MMNRTGRRFIFFPMTSWMNDPNGLVFIDKHISYILQYFPDSTIWGPMHWGHAVSRDLLHWKQEGIALYIPIASDIFFPAAW
ncbi:MAG: hypothetical protein WDM78_17270 [Puia sp.]